MENISADAFAETASPQSQLNVIKNLDKAASMEWWVPETPSWHAPVYSAVIGGVFAWVIEPDHRLAMPALIAALIMWSAILVDSTRRRKVRGSRHRRLSSEAIGAFIIMFVVTMASCAVWLIGLPVPAVDENGGTLRLWAAVPLWLASTAIFLGGIAAVNRYRMASLKVQP